MDRMSYNTVVNLGITANNVTQQYRRNGKLQSCEPCRKSKLRCDHVTPVCGRCIKRRIVSKCVYHPAPLTQKRENPARLFPSPSSSTSANVSDVIQSIEASSTTFTPRTVSFQPQDQISLPPRARAASAPVALDDRRDSNVRANPGFLGSTSYSAIFEAGLGPLGVTELEAATSHDIEDAPLGGDIANDLAGETLSRSCKVLSIFKDFLLVTQFVNRWSEINEASGEIVIMPMIRHWLKEIWTYHRDTLRDQQPDKIRRLSERIWRNTRTPLRFDGSITPQNWASLSTGHNLRWEVVCIIIADIGLAAQNLDPLDDIFREHNTTRDVLSKRMLYAVESCLAFCRECESREDLFQWCLSEGGMLTGALKGQGSYETYQQTGEMVNTMLAMGFQQTIKADERTPFFLAELRKRCRMSMYGTEIAVASLLGRPSRLSHRYTSLELPLELSDAELFMNPDQLAAIMTQFDSKGWRIKEHWQRITYMRAAMYHVPFREDILDISLGNYNSYEILDRVAQIRKSYETAWAEAPEFVKRARDTPARETKSLIQALFNNVVRHGYLANELLLQQVLIRKTGASPERMISFARLVFRDIMSLSGRRGILKEYRMDFIWLLASHGLRSAAILAVELYKQEQLPVYPANPTLQRAETIRELSIFVERLGAMEPGDGMYAFCDQGRRVISCILDKILAPPRPAPPQPPEQEQLLGLDQLAVMDFEGLDASLNQGNDADFMHWLENMDWSGIAPPGPCHG